ncbi:hypothetical protein J6590_098864 [Homalodisca vitripennis]|nr:hypothetical protein J6590_029137 [Homalodisca vitripennis]KAG8294638.1 hypothetical protein J6590_098864 [Homalodisca vitripennis]
MISHSKFYLVVCGLIKRGHLGLAHQSEKVDTLPGRCLSVVRIIYTEDYNLKRIRSQIHPHLTLFMFSHPVTSLSVQTAYDRHDQDRAMLSGSDAEFQDAFLRIKYSHQRSSTDQDAAPNIHLVTDDFPIALVQLSTFAINTNVI